MNIPINLTEILRRIGAMRRIEEMAKKYKVNPSRLLDAFSLRVAQVYKRMLVNTIKSQRLGRVALSRLFPPLSPAYKKRKVYIHRNDFWVNTERLVKNIRVWKFKGERLIGIPKNVYYPNGTPVVDVANYLENGTRVIPPRPLFRLVFARLIANLPRLLQEMEEGLKRKYRG